MRRSASRDSNAAMLIAILAAADLFAAIQAQDLPRVRELLLADPALASSRNEQGASAVSAALGVQVKEGFLPRSQNQILDAILAARPELNPQETCAVGDPAALVAKDPQFVRTVFKTGWTPLHAAAFGGNAAAASRLLKAGADINARARNKFENTPLQVSLLTQSHEVAKLLLTHGADVNAQQAEGITALHEAAQAGDVEMIRALLAAGADPHLRSKQFGTARELALKAGHDAAAQLLR
jgi:ankyrin repeat protein